jgi:3-oxoacyl-[acyl-carrier protein] reductase
LLCRIGAACAKELALYGPHLALTYSSNKVGIDDLIEELITKHGYSKRDATSKGDDPAFVTVYQVDLSSVEKTQNLFEEIQNDYQKTPDILISNAGYGKRRECRCGL